MKGKKGGSAMGGLPVAKMSSNPDTAGPATTDVVFGKPAVVASAKKKSLPSVMGTAAKPRMDRAGFKRGGHVKAKSDGGMC